MKAITLTQPWATLCVANTHEQPTPLKTDETRSFQLRASSLPLRLAIHAGKGHAGLRDMLCHPQLRRFREPYATALQQVRYSARDPWWNKWPAGDEVDGSGRTYRPLPLAAIVGLVTVVACEALTDAAAVSQKRTAMNLALGNFTVGRYAWRLTNAVELYRPIPCAGAQGIWYLPPDVLAQIPMAFQEP